MEDDKDRTATFPTSVCKAEEHTASTPKKTAAAQKAGFPRSPSAARDNKAPSTTPKFSQISSRRSTFECPCVSHHSATFVAKSMPKP